MFESISSILESSSESIIFILENYSDSWWVSILFIFARAIPVIIAPIPGVLVDAFGIATFGVAKGFILAEAGIVIGSAVAFGVGRFGRRFLRKTSFFKNLEEWEKQIDPNSSFWTLVLARMISSPAFDYISYAAGLTTLTFKKYILATIIGTIPIMLLIYTIGTTILKDYLVNFILLTALLIIIWIIYLFVRRIYFLHSLGKDIILVDKESGMTSYDIIRNLKRKEWSKKIGHAGTLDPFATGLMIIARDKSTKKLSHFLGLSKEYRVLVSLGSSTDTGDIDGEVIEEKEVPEINKALVSEIISNMKGDIDLKVPKYSAIKKNGKALYKYARNGEDVEIPTKTMHITNSKVHYVKDNEILITIGVKSGTYIRSIVEELGRQLGTIAHTKELRRISIGKYKVSWSKEI
jgi:tRNA pseudouridine55 synthase